MTDDTTTKEKKMKKDKYSIYLFGGEIKLALILCYILSLYFLLGNIIWFFTVHDYSKDIFYIVGVSLIVNYLYRTEDPKIMRHARIIGIILGLWLISLVITALYSNIISLHYQGII